MLRTFFATLVFITTLFVVSLHLKVLLLCILYFTLVKKFSILNERKNRWMAFGLFVLLFIFTFPDRTSDKTSKYQSIYFDKSTKEEKPMPIVPYLFSFVGEGDGMAIISLVGKFIPTERLSSMSAVSDVFAYIGRVSFFNNNFHLPYRNMAWAGTPPHNVPFQLAQQYGRYKNLNHYFLSIPDVIDEETEVIVFCHGYAGNWLLYSGIFTEHTNAIIISVETPNFSGTFTNNDMRNIVDNVIPHALDRIGQPEKKKIHLVGLSNGTSAINTALRIYPRLFKSYTILSANLYTMPKRSANVYVVYGSNDRSGGVNRSIPRGRYHRHVIPDEDHTLIVSNPQAVFDILKLVLN